MGKRGGLGKGLEALFEENIKSQKDILKIDIDKIEANSNQPRKKFDDDKLKSLAESIKENGILQPILVREIEKDRYQIVAGERRFRAAKMAGLEKISVFIKEIEDEKITEIALIENLQREDLNPIEEAKGYISLIDRYGLTQDDVSKKVGKSRSYVTNSIRLLNLPDEVKKEVEEKNLTSGQARALLGIKDKDELIEIAKTVIEKGLSVREIEKLVSLKKEIEKRVKVKKENKDNIKENIFKELENSMKTELRRNVKIEVLAGEKGRITIDFYNRDELISMAYNLAGLKK